MSTLLVAPAEKVVWRCFHCGDAFTDERCARLHFGRDEDSAPACQIKAGAEQGLLGALRDAEYAAADAMRAIADECTDAAKAYYSQMTRHNQALRNAEELGYERGLADGREAIAPFANVGELIEAETTGFADEHEFELLLESGHLFARLKVADFRAAFAALTRVGAA